MLRLTLSKVAALLFTFAPLVLGANTVRVIKTCFATNETFTVSFTVDSPKPGDFVGIFPSAVPTNSLINFVGWAWTCGSKSCVGARSSGTMTIANNQIDAGLYKAVLCHNSQRPFVGIAVSQTFRIGPGCAPGPPATFAPTTARPTSPTTPAPRTPTKSPVSSGRPTVAGPTPRPTPALRNAVWTDKATYAFNQAIKVQFTSQSPQVDDFLAIYPSIPGSNNILPDGLLWLWKCNRQGTACPANLSKGNVTFGPTGPSSNWTQSWPLQGGQYRAYLLRNADQGPWSMIAQSNLFTVQTNPNMTQIANQALQQARDEIAAILRTDGSFTPQWLRMGFHDCVGGCDGCIDLANPDNAGLNSAISMLDPLVNQFATPATGLSRTDIWMLATVVGVDVARHGTVKRPISFDMKWFGRVDCEKANAICKDRNGVPVPCNSRRGPHRDIPGVNLNTQELFQFFRREFGFNQSQTVAIMGGHTVGKMFKKTSGIDAPDGWVIDNVSVDNEYYSALVGPVTSNMTQQDKLNLSPEWVREVQSNAGTAFPDKHVWSLNPLKKHLKMTNSDVALVRNFSPANMNPVTGEVNCTFQPKTGTPVCPFASGSFDIAIQFGQDNDLWLSAFKSVLDLMVTNGYNRTSCSGPVCPLTLKNPQFQQQRRHQRGTRRSSQLSHNLTKIL